METARFKHDASCPLEIPFWGGEEKTRKSFNTELLEAVSPLISHQCQAQTHPAPLHSGAQRDASRIPVSRQPQHASALGSSQPYILSPTVRENLNPKAQNVISFRSTQTRAEADARDNWNVRLCRDELRWYLGLRWARCKTLLKLRSVLEFFGSYICEQHASRGSRREVWLADRKDCQQIADRSRRALEGRGEAK